MQQVRNRQFILGVIATLVVNLCFAIGVNVISWAGRKGINPFAISCVRNWFSVILFTVYASFFLKGKVKKLLPKDYKWIILSAVTGLVINGVAATYGYTFTLVTHSSLILAMAPIWMILGGAIFYKEKLHGRVIIGVLMGMIATVMIIFSKENPENEHLAKNIPYGDFFVLFSTLGYATYVLISKKIATKGYHPIQLLKYTFIASSIIITPLCGNYFLAINWHILTALEWIFFFICLGFIQTVLPYLLISYAVPAIGSLNYGLLVFLQPLFACLIGILFLGEQLTSIIIYASVLLFIGLYIAQTASAKVKHHEI
ncbi:MAG: DMT family transporter [Phycisphaerales bacterium]|nr:DMT family transporter [Phycisphaerales bacterium]